MDKFLFEHIYELKINEVKMQINLKVDEKTYYTEELSAIYKQLSLDEINELKGLAKEKLLLTKDLLKKCNAINKKTVQNNHKTTSFDAENYYDLSTKKLACEGLIEDCNELKYNLLDKGLQI